MSFQPKYPTDPRGVPLSVAEVDIPYLESDRENNHHLNFYRRAFGATALSQAFRDLERFQEIMPVRSHELLHRKFGGIAVPHAGVMLDEIYEAKEQNEKLKIYDQSLKQYVYYDINDELWHGLSKDYGILNLV